MDEETKEIQQNELAALRAIFMDDYRDVDTKTVWNVKQSTAEFVVRIRPTDDDELKSSVSVGLHVKFPKTYPRAAPQITLEDAQMLSDAQVHGAAVVAKQKVVELLGNEMVYEVAIAVSEYITENNSAEQASRPSFYQQMVDREKAGREAQMEREAAYRRQQQAADAEEQAALQRRIYEELERKQQQVLVDQQRQKHMSDIAEAVNSVAGRWAEGIQLLKFDNAVYLDPQAMARSGTFTTVALEASSVVDPLCTMFDAYPTDLVGASIHLSDRFTVQCFIVTTPHYLMDQGRRALERINARVGDLAQIRHQNLVSVYAGRMEVQDERSANPGIRLWVLSDMLSAHDGSTLEDVLESCGAIAAAQTRTYLQHMLLSLVSLHAAGFIHRSIMPSNVLLAKEGRRRFVAKLFNTSYREEMVELHRITPLSAAIGDSAGNDIRVAPEVIDRPDMMGRKNDVWCVGVTALQMVLGLDALRDVAIGAEHTVLEANRGAMSPELFAVLARLLTPDHQRRPTAMEVLNDPFFSQVRDGEPSVYRQALDSASRGLTFELQRTAAAARATETKAVEPPNAAETRHASKRRPQQPQPQPQPQPAPKALVAVSEAVLQPSASRYRTDFEEVEFLGKGGFGSVVKARNRIDGRFYAIKKIKLDPRDNEGSKKIFREVTTLSRLHHQNIVRYYTTWVEDYDDSAAMAGGMGGILEESESMQSSDDESPGDISLGLSHSSWSTEQSISSSSSSSSSSDSDEQDAEPASDASDSLSESGVCFASPSRSESGNSSAGVGGGSERLYSDETTNDDALDALNPRVAGSDMLAPAKGRRTSNVFSAIRFGTMRTGGQDDAAARQSRAVTLKTYGPVREFAASATEDDEARSSSDGLGAMLVREQQAQQRHMLSARQKGKTPKKQKHPAAKRRRGQILYIQMEYCENKTLSDMIREGLDEKACWRLFGQILEGLHHIHERSVIHRDLKPVNAFLDGAGDVKIGDFGLATSSFAPMESAAAARVDGVERSGADEALTADIGTSLYVAPEVTAKSSGGAAMRYNQKVDMYSLGIIFFEMCYPLKTGMERATVLHNLRKPEIVFPADFAAERMQLQYQIIKRLLSHNPRLRPSSAELLESGLLPPKMDDDEYIRETIKTIANPSQPYFAKLLASLFARATDKHIDATFDYRANDVNTEQLHAVFLDRIRETMTRVFRTHAAVELSTPALAPRVDLLDTYQTPACYLDARGHVVQLPYDQTVPFARYVARTRMTEIKRYSFDRFFVANAAGGQPVSHSAAAFDAVTNRSAHAVAAAEVIAVVCEVFDALPPLRRMPMVLLVNHMAILDAVLAYCGILPAGESDNADALFVRNVCFCLSALYREKAHIVRQRIQVMSLTTGAKLHPHALDRLQPFMDIRGDLGTVQREVLARIGSECGMGGTAQAMRGAELARAAARAFSELRYVEATVRHFGVAVPIAYSPLFNHHYAYYEGAYAFQFMTEPATKSRVPHVLAIGGRYDGLLRRFRHLAGSYLPSETGDTKPHSNAAAAQTAPQPPQPPTDDDVAADAAAAAAASISFARRTGSLHSTDVWQQMYAKPGGSRGGSRAGKSYDDSVPVSIGTSLSDGSAALGTARDVVCVGVQIHLDRVIQEMARYQQKVLQTSATSATPTFGLWTRKRCDVVVASFGTHPLLKERISLARDLWANGLRTDFLFNDDPEMTMERLVEICSEQGMNWIVTLKRKPPPAAFVYKVKNILRRVECEVPRHALIDWLHTDIGEQLKLDLVAHDARGSASATSAAGASAGGGGASSTSRALREDGASGSTLMRAATTSGSSNTGNSGPTQGANTSNSGASAGDSDATGGGRLELTIVNPQFGSKNVSRSKHKQRLMLTDRAKTSVTRVISDVRGAPVLVIDLGPELLRRMAGEPSILSEAGYKRVMELCSAHQRAYVVELHSAMERHRREGCQYVWLYSVKGDYAVTYKL